MNNFFQESLFFGTFISFFSYGIGTLIKSKFKSAFFNPLLVAIILNITTLFIFHIKYEVYYESAKYISYLLTPATICLAVPLYEQFELLKKNIIAVIVGISTGVITSLCSVLLLAYMFKLE